MPKYSPEQKKKNIHSFFAFSLIPQFESENPEARIKMLFEKTLEWFLEKKQGYYGYKWDDNTYHILMKGNMDTFQLSMELDRLVIYPFDRCSEKTIKGVCKEINENISGDVKVKKYSSVPNLRS